MYIYICIYIYIYIYVYVHVYLHISNISIYIFHPSIYLSICSHATREASFATPPRLVSVSPRPSERAFHYGSTAGVYAPPRRQFSARTCYGCGSRHLFLLREKPSRI